MYIAYGKLKQVTDEKFQNRKDAGTQEKSWFHMPFTHSETPARKDDTGWFGWGGANNTNDKGSGGLLGIGGGGEKTKEKSLFDWVRKMRTEADFIRGPKSVTK